MSLQYLILMKAYLAMLSAFSLIVSADFARANDLQDHITQTQLNVIRNTGITREEGITGYKIFMECLERGFPQHNMWYRCMQPTYVRKGIPMPSSPMGIVLFSLTERCRYLTNQNEILACVMQGQ